MRVTIWFGFFHAEEDLEGYLEEQSDDAPLWSPFAEDTGVDLVAIERIESSWLEEPTAEPRVLLAGHELPPGLLEAVEACWAATGGAVVVNAAIVVQGEVEPSPRSVETEDYAIVLVGSFSPTG